MSRCSFRSFFSALVATLFRLAQRVVNPFDPAPGVCWQVIEAGNFVVGGNYVVGFVIFLILVIVQFLVITRCRAGCRGCCQVYPGCHARQADECRWRPQCRADHR